MLKGKPPGTESASQHHDGDNGKTSYPEPTIEAEAVDHGGVARGERRPRDVDGDGGLVSVASVHDDDVAVDIDAYRGTGLRGRVRGWGSVSGRDGSRVFSFRGESISCHN